MPAISNWAAFEPTDEGLARHLRDEANVGVLTGLAGVTDVDLDHPMARSLAPSFLPTTSRRHGRPGAPASHYWYRLPTLMPTIQYADPLDSSMLVELRGDGGMTVVPPSVHPCGETLRWEEEGELSEASANHLAAVAQLAAATLFSKHWPAEGSRHHAALALGGMLARGGWDRDRAAEFVRHVARAAGDEEFEGRGENARTSFERVAAGGIVVGAPSLAEIIDERVVRRAAGWLQIPWSRAEARSGLLQHVFTGDRLRAVRERAARVSPIPGVLDTDPHLHVLVALPKTGKTTFACWVAQAWAEGRAPWEGAPALSGSRVLIISREQPVERLDDLLLRLGRAPGAASGDSWVDKMLIVARDPNLAREVQCLLTLDDSGIGALRALLSECEAGGEGVGLVILDSLSRLKPASVEENDNDAMTAWLDKLEAIALEHQVYVLLIHHKGHDPLGTRNQARTAGRGASSIGAVAQALLLLENVSGQPTRRRLKVEGNFLFEAHLEFEVADEEDNGGIHFFRLLDPLAAYDPVALVKAGEELSTNDLAWRLSRKAKEPGKNPPGNYTKLAAQLRDHWAGKGCVEVFEGERGAKILRRRIDLASSPRPRSDTEARSGDPTSPTAPIEARGGGEVTEGSPAATSLTGRGGELRS